MPITINGVPLVRHGHVNRQALGASPPASYYQLHPHEFELAKSRSPAPRARASSQQVATTPR